MPAPLITRPPILIDPVGYSRQFIPEVDPFLFKDGSSIFVVLQAQRAILGNQPISVFSVDPATGIATALDTAHQPSGDITANIEGLSCALDATRHEIQILRLVNDSGFKQVVTPFNTSTKLYETDSAESVVVVDNLFACDYVRSDGVVIVPTGLHVGGVQRLVDFTVTAGVWGGPTNLDSDTGGGSTISTYQVLVDSSDRGHLFYRDNSGFLQYAQLSPLLVKGTPVLISNAWDQGGIDELIVGNNLVVAWTEIDVLKVAIGTPLSAPVFTTYTIGSVPASGSFSYPALALNKDGKITVFIIWEDVSGPPIAQIFMFTFDGAGSWPGPVLFYDAVANPPTDAIAFPNPHNTAALQLPNGVWLFYVTMDVHPPGLGTYSAGFILTNVPPSAGGWRVREA